MRRCRVDIDRLYAEAKDEMEPVLGVLFDLAMQQLDKRGAFLPFAATLPASGDLVMHAADPGRELTNSPEVLAALHAGLSTALTPGTRAVGVCEQVKITLDTGDETEAVKVLLEHANGLVVAFYLPVRRLRRGKWESGELLVVPAAPEVGLVHPPG
jgi:hypothetical protein